MSDKPPGREPADELDAEYRRLAAQDASAPSEAVRQAVHAYAARLAQERGDAASAAHARAGRAQRPLLRRGALFGTLAAAVVAGLVIAPRFMIPRPSAGAPVVVQERTQIAAADAHRPPQGGLSESAPAESVPPESPTRSALVAAAPPAQPELAKAAPPNVRAQRPSAASASGFASTQSAARQAQADAEAKSEARAAGDVTPERLVLSDRVAGASANRASPAAPAPAAKSVASASLGGALVAAAARGDVAGARDCLDEGADVNAQDGAGRTALLLATLRGHAEVVTLLLAAGADPNLADARGVRPLAAADAGGQADIAAVLRSHGAR
jgi:hypothetical protein